MKKLVMFSVVMILASTVAQAATMNVPFFRSAPTFATATNAWVGIKNTSANDQTITITYTAVNASGVPEDQVGTFPLGANAALEWEPVQTLQGENEGSVVPNMTIQGTAGTARCCGAVKIDGSDTLTGRYQEIDSTNNTRFGHALVG